jgi:hypothetical protein
MEAIATVGLVGAIVQLMDFSSKLVSASTEIYRSSKGILSEHASIEAAATDLRILQSEVANSMAGCGSEMQDLCIACDAAASDLLDALSKVKAQESGQKWKSIRKALRSIWSKEEIVQMESRLTSLRIELNLRVSATTRFVLLYTYSYIILTLKYIESKSTYSGKSKPINFRSLMGLRKALRMLLQTRRMFSPPCSSNK